MTTDILESVLKEARDDIAKERLVAFLKRYGLFIIGGIVCLLCSTVGVLLWQHHQHTLEQQAATAFFEASLKTKEQRIKEFTAVAATHPDTGYGLMATLQTASTNQTALPATLPPPLDHALTIIQGWRTIGHMNTHTLKALNSLSAGTTPFNAQATEILALDAYTKGDVTGAADKAKLLQRLAPNGGRSAALLRLFKQ
jgi:hypothetical protein